MYKAFIQLKYCWELYIYNITVCLYLAILFPEELKKRNKKKTKKEKNELYIKIKQILKLSFNMYCVDSGLNGLDRAWRGFQSYLFGDASVCKSGGVHVCVCVGISVWVCVCKSM